MAIEFTKYRSRDDWLKARTLLGGSDAAAIIGLSPWMSNVDLWRIKTGRACKSRDLSNNYLVDYGRNAEFFLRELFALDYPQYKVEYCENNMFVNDKYPFAHASLDGWLTENPTGRRGILEIKTATIANAQQSDKWRDKVPDNYYCQLLWYMGVFEADFAILKAQLKREPVDGEMYCYTKHYYFDRKDVQEDIDYIMQKGAEFFEYCKKDIAPPLVLPAI